jgi:hypothetical protein
MPGHDTLPWERALVGIVAKNVELLSAFGQEYGGENFLPPPAFKPLIFQYLAICYTFYAIPVSYCVGQKTIAFFPVRN